MSGFKSKLSPVIFVVLVLLLLVLVFADTINNRQNTSSSDIAMGTVISQTLVGRNAKKSSEEIAKRIKQIENENLSRNVDTSDIFKINNSSGVKVDVSRDTVKWIEASLEICEHSGYALDISVGNLTKLWDFGSDNTSVPTQEEIDEALKTVGCDKISVYENAIQMPAYQSLDLGALGKGIACDEAKIIAQNNGLKRAIVSVGGSILLYGDGDFKVGVRNPLGTSNEHMGILNITAACVSTSGDYEKVLRADGKTYHHILNPKTGCPSSNGLRSVTIVCESGIVSDALSTACFVLGYENSIALLEKHDAQAVFIFDDNSVVVTKGLNESFSIDNSDFKMRLQND
ncbi:MAG TPA: FAD:protein FMN transferase [Clostridia bacterium]|nr:FAD:protein FMN transferase [Clostridia bacterium]